MIRAATLMVVAILFAGCGEPNRNVTLCYPQIPQPGKIIDDPAFSELTYSMADPKNQYVIWADSRYDYTAAVEYTLVPPLERQKASDNCIYGITMRFALPPDAKYRQRLQVFARAVGPVAGYEPAAMERDVVAVLESGEKIRPRHESNGIITYAGRISHPSRGEMFFVTVKWPHPSKGPEAAPK